MERAEEEGGGRNTGERRDKKMTQQLSGKVKGKRKNWRRTRGRRSTRRGEGKEKKEVDFRDVEIKGMEKGSERDRKTIP